MLLNLRNVNYKEVGDFADPEVPNWSNIDLPKAWPDDLKLSRYADFKLFLRKISGKQPQRVKLPEDLPLRVQLPKYLLQEFHNLPNGNYSKRITRGYSTGFDWSMLGKTKLARLKLVHDLSRCGSVLDVGCGGGHTAACLSQAGIKDVWGLDPSPYLLQHAAHDFPHVKFVQGLAEDTGFVEKRFDGISACFVFHEIPPLYANQALKEFHRILKPHGLVSIAEPSPEQMQMSYLNMLKLFGLTGPYFRFLAQRVNEPFVSAWHKKDYQQWAWLHGFELIHDKTDMPIRYLLLKKR